MAAMALTNIAMRHPETAAASSQAISRWIERSLEKDVRLFDERAWNANPLDERILSGDEGHIGYYGHLNMLIGCYTLLNPDGRFDAWHRKISEAIARRMRKYPHRQVETYPGQNYPPDTAAAVASLRVADMNGPPHYAALISEWV